MIIVTFVSIPLRSKVMAEERIGVSIMSRFMWQSWKRLELEYMNAYGVGKCKEIEKYTRIMFKKSILAWLLNEPLMNQKISNHQAEKDLKTYRCIHLCEIYPKINAFTVKMNSKIRSATDSIIIYSNTEID